MKVTLDTLREEFEAAICQARRDLIPLFNGDTDHQADKALDGAFRLSPWPKEWRSYLLAGGTYAIARDHSLNAAMLYKLSDGAIDPREVQS